MSNIKVTIAGRDIKVADGYEKPSAGDVNTCAVSLAIESGGVWDSLPHKRVTFSTRTASVTVDYAPTITVPHEVMASPGALYITLTGYDADGIEVARTHRMTYPIEVARAGADEGSEPSPSTLDVVSRIDALAADLEEKRDTDYWRGEPGAPGAPGKDADISGAEAAKDAANNAATNANEAATLANEAADNANEMANTIKQRAEAGEFNGEPGADGYSPTANVTKVGGTATITVTDKNGTTTATVSDGAPGSDAQATDVRINGTSITADGVADIPAAKANTFGLFKSHPNYGFYYGFDNNIFIQHADSTKIDARSNSYQPITPANLDYAVKAAMCDGKGAAWAADEQKAARERMNAADANKVYIMQKQIENLQGIAATEETDSTEAYTKTVPTGAQKWASLDKVGGKTVVWNQLYRRLGDTAPSGGLNAEYKENGHIRIFTDAAGIQSDIMFYFMNLFSNDVLPAGHKYLINAPHGGTGKYRVSAFSSTGARLFDAYEGPEIYSASEPVARLAFVGLTGWVSTAGLDFNPFIIDLTSAFGSGNEPTSLDDPRIAFIKAYAEEHPEYNPGELMSAEVVEVESKGKNLCNIQIPEYTYESYFLINTLEKAKELGNCIRLDAGEYVLSSKSTDQTMIKCFLDNGQMVTSGDTISGYYLGKISSAQDWYDLTYQGYRWTIGSKENMAVGLKIVLKEPCWLFICTTINVGSMIDPQIEHGTTVTEYSPYQKHTFPIPQSVRDLCPGYGWSAGTVCNEIDFERKVYVKRVDSVDLGTLSWIEGTSSVGDRNRWQSAGIESLVNNYADSDTANIACAKYVAISAEETWRANVGVSVGSNRRLFIYDNAYESVVEFKASIQGVLLYYELAEPVEVNLSDVLPNDHFIEVEAGGTVTFKQASTQLPVPSSVTYQISTSEVIANA